MEIASPIPPAYCHRLHMHTRPQFSAHLPLLLPMYGKPAEKSACPAGPENRAHKLTSQSAFGHYAHWAGLCRKMPMCLSGFKMRTVSLAFHKPLSIDCACALSWHFGALWCRAGTTGTDECSSKLVQCGLRVEFLLRLNSVCCKIFVAGKVRA